MPEFEDTAIRSYGGTEFCVVPHDPDAFTLHLVFSPHIRTEVLDRHALTGLRDAIDDALANRSRIQ